MDSAGKVGGAIAAGIFGSIFFPSIASWLISDWIAGQLAENPVQLLLCCALALVAGVGVACSVSIPLFKRKLSKLDKRPTQEQMDAALASKDAEIAALEKRPTREQMDAALAAKDSEIAELKRRPTQEQMDAAIASKDSEIANLKDEIEKAKGNEDPEYKTPSVDLVMKMSPVVAARVCEAYRKGKYIPISDIEPVAIKSIGRNDLLFELRYMVNPFGQPLEPKEYGLADAWMAFLDDPVHLKQMETMAGGFLRR